jgi:hypothetical protein
MKQIKIYFITLILFLVCSVSFAQVTVGKVDPDRYVFWFYVRAEIKLDKNKKMPVYVIRPLGKTPKSGATRKYEKDLWRYLLGGQQLAIGPFRDYQDVKRAVNMYDLARHTDETMEKEIQNFSDSTAANEYFWFVLKFKISKRKKKYLLERTAARVHPGSLKQFKQMLWEGLSFQQLAIGPFATQEEAEEAKRLYRIEEN